MTAAVLRSQPATAETLNRFGLVTKAVVGIAAWDAPHSTVYDALSERERETLREAERAPRWPAMSWTPRAG